MFVARAYLQPTPAAIALDGQFAAVRDTWSNPPTWVPYPAPYDQTEIVDGHKLRVIGSGPFDLNASSALSGSGVLTRIVRNSEANVLWQSTSTSSSTNTMPVLRMDLEDGDLLWMQVNRTTSFSRNVTSAYVAADPVT